MRQHHAARSQPDPGGPRPGGGQQHSGGAGGYARHRMMLGRPEAVIPQGLSLYGPFHGVVQRRPVRESGAGARTVQQRQLHICGKPRAPRKASQTASLPSAGELLGAHGLQELELFAGRGAGWSGEPQQLLTLVLAVEGEAVQLQDAQLGVDDAFAVALRTETSRSSQSSENSGL